MIEIALPSDACRAAGDADKRRFLRRRGLWPAEPYWNQGLMTEAIASVNDFAFRALGIESFYVCNAASNQASRGVKQKTGAEFVGYIELQHHNGQSRSEKWKVTRENWLRQSSLDLT